MGSCEAAVERLCDPASEVSAHYLIDASGVVHVLVDEKLRAWHAGAGGWGAVEDVNSRSIGVELDNPGDRPFPEAQMTALTALLAAIMGRWSIPPERVIGHSDLAPARKSDPGPRFDWRRLALAGLSVWPDIKAPPGPADAPDPQRFHQALSRIGYPEAAIDLRLRAFRLRFRPGASGPLTGADLAAAENIAERFPVDRDPAGA